MNIPDPILDQLYKTTEAMLEETAISPKVTFQWIAALTFLNRAIQSRKAHLSRKHALTIWFEEVGKHRFTPLCKRVAFQPVASL